MQILNAQGLAYLDQAIADLKKLVKPSSASSSTSSSSSSTSTSSDEKKSLSEQMLAETLSLLERVRNNNTLEYWRKDTNKQAMVDWLHLLDQNQYTFVPVVFDAGSRQLAGAVLPVLRGIQLDAFLATGCRVALKSMVSFAGGDLDKALQILADNLQLNITLYDMVDTKQQKEKQEGVLRDQYVNPAMTYLDCAIHYFAHMQGLKTVSNAEHLATFTNTLKFPAGIETMSLAERFEWVINYYNQHFGQNAKSILNLDIPYSQIVNVDEMIKAKEPTSIYICDDKGEVTAYRNPFLDMGFLGKKSLFVRGIAINEEDFENMIAKSGVKINAQLQGIRYELRNQYQAGAAQAIFDKFELLTKQLHSDIQVYIKPTIKSSGLFGTIKAKVNTNGDKKAIADRLTIAIEASLKKGTASENAIEVRNQSISQRVFSVFKELLGESKIHAACVGHQQISFGRLGDIFNQYIPMYYQLFNEIDFSNDPYVQNQLKLQTNLVIPGQESEDDTKSVAVSATSSMRK